MTVLVWGIPSEPPVAMVIEALERAGHDFVAVHPRESARQHAEVSVGPGVRAGEASLRGWLDVNGRRVDLSALTGTYVRPVEPELLPEVAAMQLDDPARTHAHRIHDALVAFTEASGSLPGCRVANRLSAMASNLSKPFQAQAIMRHGFSTPDTLVTDDVDEALAFAAEHGEVVYKSISGVRSIVTTFDPSDAERLNRLKWCPVQFQERIDGPDVRVHVVGGEVWSARIETDAVDYRYARLQVGADARVVGMSSAPTSRACASRWPPSSTCPSRVSTSSSRPMAESCASRSTRRPASRGSRTRRDFRSPPRSHAGCRDETRVGDQPRLPWTS